VQLGLGPQVLLADDDHAVIEEGLVDHPELFGCDAAGEVGTFNQRA
jgi:hypothetical protein